MRFRLPKELDPYCGQYNATAFGLSCPQQAAALTLPSGLPNATIQYLKGLSSTTQPSVGEDCEAAVGEALPHLERNADDNCRFECQCRYTCQRHTQFEAAGCSGACSQRFAVACSDSDNPLDSGYMGVRRTQCLQTVVLTDMIYYPKGGFEDGTSDKYG